MIKQNRFKSFIFGSLGVGAIGLLISTGIMASSNKLSVDKLDSSAGITLNQDVSYFRGSKIYMQDGSVIERLSHLNEKRPYCYFSFEHATKVLNIARSASREGITGKK